MAPERPERVVEPFTVACVQAWWELYNPNFRGEYEGESFRRRNLKRMCEHIDHCFAYGGSVPPVKLVTFSEFGLGGCYDSSTTVDQVIQYQAITIPGPETEVLAEKARKYKTYIAAVNHEISPDIPGNYYNTAFILNPEGKIILKYRKMNAAFACNPHDIMDKYINPVTGTRDFFPVVDTRIGRLGCFICGDLMIPEFPRAYAFKGCEVLLHLNGGFVGEMPRMVLQVRAWDNTLYVVEQNFAGYFINREGDPSLGINPSIDSSGGGQSRIIDYSGNIIAKSEDRAPQIVKGVIDVMALRETRKRFRFGITGGDSVTRCRTELYREFYNQTVFPPNRVLRDGPIRQLNDATVTSRRKESLANLAQMRKQSWYAEEDAK
jgi:predicted amidohydrolase